MSKIKYGPVIFRDVHSGVEYVIPSTLGGGDEVPIINVDTSASSHPYWTGQASQVRSSRVERFNERYGR